MAIAYRMHWNACPPLTVENAQSVSWAERALGYCFGCDGTGTALADKRECLACDGTGNTPVREGYSACLSADELRQYFAARAIPSDEDGLIAVFRAEVVGFGIDSEVLVIPRGRARLLKPSVFFRAR